MLLYTPLAARAKSSTTTKENDANSVINLGVVQQVKVATRELQACLGRSQAMSNDDELSITPPPNNFCVWLKHTLGMQRVISRASSLFPLMRPNYERGEDAPLWECAREQSGGKILHQDLIESNDCMVRTIIVKCNCVHMYTLNH
jgi:hypothetical protein